MQSQRQQARKASRRTRLPLSCEACRVRKLKCNREKPCQNCVARDDQATCVFRGNAHTVLQNSNGDVRSHAAQNGEGVRQRLDHLEGLIKKLISESPQSSIPPQLRNGIGAFTPETSPNGETANDVVSHAVSPDMPANSTGKTVMDGVHSVYLGGDDWSAVLKEINDLKKTWSPEQEEDSEDFEPMMPHTVDGASLLFEQVKPLEKINIISSLPPRQEVDWLLAQFFDRKAFPIAVPPMLHEPTFMREYEQHWKNPSQTNFIWLGLLFSILSVTMLAFHQHGEPTQYQGLSESLFQLYRMRTAQCLQGGDIAKCQPYTVETLRFNVTAEHSRKDDNRRGLWIMSGVLMRAAVNMGYHRDPGQTPGISVLQAEYRRRVWIAVVSIDDMASFLGGFPRAMSAIYSDTEEPRNIHDWELYEGMTELPPSRPFNEVTGVTYLIAKARLLRELGRIADYICLPHAGPYDRVIEIDRAVHDAYNKIPEYMKLSSEQMLIGIKSTPMARKEIDMSNIAIWSMYHRSLCTLHRRFLSQNRQDSRFRLSRERCIDSGIQLLRIQEYIGPLYYRSSQARQMLMLGAMVLFQELALRRKAPNDEELVGPESSVLYNALERSCKLFEEAMAGCEEVRKVHQFLVKMLSSFQGSGEQAASIEQVTFATPQQALISSNDEWSMGTGNDLFSFEQDWSGVDFDMNMWDSIVDESTYDAGPIY